MFHTSGLKTTLIDAVYNKSNFRSEFRFDVDKVYLSNMRILNLGVVKPANSTDASYNQLVGSYGIIKQISLMDGTETLSNMVDFNRYIAFKSFTKKNDENNSMKKFLQKNNMGYVFSDVSDNEIIEQLVNTLDIRESESLTGKGWLSLRECLPFLASSQYVPTNIFKNLRLVIEYENNSSLFTDSATLSFTTLEPLLVCEMMVNSKVSDQMMKEYQGLSWVDIETDRMVLSDVPFQLQPQTNPPGPRVAVNPNPLQQTSFLVNGFNNKRVNRVIMCNVPTVETTYKSSDNFYTQFSNIGSMNMYNQSVQVQLNGSNLFPEPMNTPNKRLASLVDNYGDATMPLSYDTYDGLLGLIVRPTEVLGNTDYTCFTMGGARVQEFVIDYSRLGVFDVDLAEVQSLGRFNQRLTLQLYGEVQKQLIIGEKGNYVIGYV
jgi:hypothetical protein